MAALTPQSVPIAVQPMTSPMVVKRLRNTSFRTRMGFSSMMDCSPSKKGPRTLKRIFRVCVISVIALWRLRRRLLISEVVQVKHIYESCGGMCQYNEVAHVLQQSGIHMTDAEVRKLLDQVRYREGYVITLPQFQHLFEQRKRQLMACRETEEEEFFNSWSKGKDVVDVSKLKNVIAEFELALDINERFEEDTATHRAEKDTRTSLTRSEFRKMLLSPPTPASHNRVEAAQSHQHLPSSPERNSPLNVSTEWFDETDKLHAEQVTVKLSESKITEDLLSSERLLTNLRNIRTWGDDEEDQELDSGTHFLLMPADNKRTPTKIADEQENDKSAPPVLALHQEETNVSHHSTAPRKIISSSLMSMSEHQKGLERPKTAPAVHRSTTASAPLPNFLDRVNKDLSVRMQRVTSAQPKRRAFEDCTSQTQCFSSPALLRMSSKKGNSTRESLLLQCTSKQEDFKPPFVVSRPSSSALKRPLLLGFSPNLDVVRRPRSSASSRPVSAMSQMKSSTVANTGAISMAENCLSAWTRGGPVEEVRKRAKSKR